MSEIHILHGRFQNLIKQTEIDINEFIKTSNSQKHQTLIELTAMKALKGLFNIDMLKPIVCRKLVEARLKVSQRLISGIASSNELEYVFRFRNFMERMQADHTMLLERNGPKLMALVLFLETDISNPMLLFDGF